jgi:ribosome biogenesis GTPase
VEFEAQVIAAFGRHLQVRDDAGACHEARPFGRRVQAVCGDRVRCGSDAAHGEVHVLEVLPRKTLLQRSTLRGGAEPVVANIDLLAVVVAALPQPDLFVVDRYLCAASSAGLAGLVVLNKSDLAGSDGLALALAPYRDAGYPTLTCSTEDGSGIAPLGSALQGHRSVFVGQSGVGKSSLIATLVPAAAITATVGALDRSEEGRHTTTAARAYDLAPSGQLFDSPGVRDFAPAIASLDPRSLGFPEIERLAADCRFLDCRHLREPACAVQDAVREGRFDARRYESYRRLRRLYEDLQTAAGPGGHRHRR